MPKFTLIVLACFFLCLSFPSQAAPYTDGACTIDDEEFLLPDCVLTLEKGQPYIAKPFVTFLFAHRREKRLAHIFSTYGWSWFDRTGRIWATHVAATDNFANDYHYGLVRVTDNGKWGLADDKGKLRVPMIYDGMYDYQKGNGWVACTGCRDGNSGDYHTFEGGSFVTLDRNGKLVSEKQ